MPSAGDKGFPAKLLAVMVKKAFWAGVSRYPLTILPLGISRYGILLGEMATIAIVPACAGAILTATVLAASSHFIHLSGPLAGLAKVPSARTSIPQLSIVSAADRANQ